ncbi:AraC family ligand binding domain-containing protein [Streptomyces sp. SCSIO 30461]|uniref:AraC family ligand binding domain-containing protein n=1 Tax=Streptomyces sp. SCSIO 30461 TaxID=3118085 RepID=UPI0030D23A9B
MASLSQPGVLARLAQLSRDASQDQGGALWRLAADGRQLDANVVRLPPGAHVAEHVEPALDVLLYITSGSGRLLIGGTRQDIAEGSVVWLPRGSRRALYAGPEGLVQLSVHRRRPGLAIQASPADTSEGGEHACLLDRVCPECGRLAPESDARYCGRCGEQLPDVA